MNNDLMKQGSVALFAGVLFGVGLSLSGMTDTQKVQGFLDLAGDWDITLAFVMGGALFVAVLAYGFILKRNKPWFHEQFELPTNKDIDTRLLLGAAMFGAGWALIGYCPGPAIASIVYGYWQTGVFIVAMLAGAWLAKRV